MIYGSINPPVFARIPRSARRILDVGCGDGTLARAIKSEWSAHITGITHSEEEAERGRGSLDAVLVADLNRFDAGQLGEFDCVICSHVLEHLTDPWQLLHALRPHLVAGGTLIVALPNLLHWRNRLALLCGKFRYTDGGLMDRTHCKFFDWQTASDLVRDAGFTVTERLADGTWPGSHFLGPLRAPLDSLALALSPGLFGWQFVLVAKPA